jgi:hypothetical protein
MDKSLSTPEIDAAVSKIVMDADGKVGFSEFAASYIRCVKTRLLTYTSHPMLRQFFVSIASYLMRTPDLHCRAHRPAAGMSEGIPSGSTATGDKPHPSVALTEPADEANWQAEADSMKPASHQAASAGEEKSSVSDSSTDASADRSPSIDGLESTSGPQDE